MEIRGSVAFITGGGNGIGRAYAEALLAGGAKVTIIDLDEAGGRKTAQEFQNRFGPDNVIFYQCDVTNHEQFERVFDQAVAHFGPMDILINNAGIMNEGAWLKMIDINVTAVVKGVKMAEKVMRKDKGGKGGRIINISSCVALSASCYVPIYTATKHAVRAYTSSQAAQIDIEKQGIQYAQIAPDPVDTDMVRLIDDVRINYYEEIKGDFKDTIPPSRCVEALLNLLKLDKMNGAILYARNEHLMYQAVERKDVGLTWNP